MLSEKICQTEQSIYKLFVGCPHGDLPGIRVELEDFERCSQ
jgi:hypothetical protein